MCSSVLLYCIVILFLLYPTLCHIPEYLPTPSNKIEQYCMMSEQCGHDTVPICGSNGDTKRTFMDLCDLLEYACDTGKIFAHVEDSPGCPTPKRPPKNKKM